ncbi:hypothetical protein PMAYCL1PPCAC_04524 [Pristionchus mayeri]|uniref:Insulin-like domain-containing protein n=1 Tax=Pristionchus mayeri TaxID=1317129 RepID=A0AAN4Z6P4_9BILA|nr:hypothetical protein PMAYCL1PPCAC_04524 [Pristionchus mayeri]
MHRSFYLIAFFALLALSSASILLPLPENAEEEPTMRRCGPTLMEYIMSLQRSCEYLSTFVDPHETVAPRVSKCCRDGCTLLQYYALACAH